jgi:hypothetical protein
MGMNARITPHLLHGVVLGVVLGVAASISDQTLALPAWHAGEYRVPEAAGLGGLADNPVRPRQCRSTDQS